MYHLYWVMVITKLASDNFIKYSHAVLGLCQEEKDCLTSSLFKYFLPIIALILV